MKPSLNEFERITAIVYGDTFSLYKEEEFDKFVEPFRIRLKVNQIDSSIFKGARCLDAGCGGGRGSILMAELGAKEVISFDLSDKNLQSTSRRAKQKGYENIIKTQQGSLLDLPFENEYFDIVWCNGVLHHTSNPGLALKEIARVLKLNGKLWLYLYGSGGIYWFTIQKIRQWVAGIKVEDAIAILRLMDAPVERIAEWIDDWFVPYLKCYTNEDVTQRLNSLGFAPVELISRGTPYDTSERLYQGNILEKKLMGEGDLRYFCTKTSYGNEDTEYFLPDINNLGSSYIDHPEVMQFGQPLDDIFALIQNRESKMGYSDDCLKLMVAKLVHSWVRTELETSSSFREEAYLQFLEEIKTLLNPLL